jgi:DNA gyrase/topoisomerase IV subunit A
MHLIIGRAFPSIEDGLKTVSRRIMYNMGTDDNKFHKGAHYVGGILSR